MKILICMLLASAGCTFTMAQNVGIGTTSPRPSAQLDVSSSNKGMLIPRMTSTQRKAINNPEFGLMVFDTDKGAIMFYDGQKWRALSFTDENTTTENVRIANDPQVYSGYGTRVAMSGDYSIVGAPKYTGGTVAAPMINAGAAYILYKGSTGWVQQAKLVPRDSSAGSYFGGAVAISGDYAVVAAANKTLGTVSYVGKVYVYKRSGTNWLVDTVFTKPNGVAGEYFGWSVAISATASGGPVVAVGIPYSTLGGISRGEVYSYRRNANNTWNLIQSIRPTDLLNYDNFGFTLNMDGDYLAVGAPLQDNLTYSYTDAGAVYMYVFGGGVFTQQQKFSGTTALAQFGATLAISNNRVAIGAPWATAYSNTSAAVYIYTRTGATWANTTYMFLYDFEVPGAPTASPRALTFGLGLALNGNDLFVGASGGLEYPNGGSSYYSSTKGSVYQYKNFSGDAFVKVRIITPQGGTYSDLFASSVSTSNGRYIIGQPKANNGNSQGTGAVVLGDIGN